MLAIAIIGSVNWLLIGVFGWNFVAAIFGSMSVLSRIVYVIVGSAGLYCLRLYSRPSDYEKSREVLEVPRRAA
jgi:uncharacterized membrane protein YuzA (DUF378 family)